MGEKGRFTLEDFRGQLQQMHKLGPLSQVMKMIPGMGQMADMDPDMDPESDMRQIEGIINSMTADERENPDKIDRSRRNRIAGGSGATPADVNNLLKQFKQMAGMMQQMAGKGMRCKMQMIKEMQEGGLFEPGAELRKEKQRSKR